LIGFNYSQNNDQKHIAFAQMQLQDEDRQEQEINSLDSIKVRKRVTSNNKKQS